MRTPVMSVLFVMLAAQSVRADEAALARYKVLGSYGELVASTKPCGPATRAEIWRFIFDDLVITRTGDGEAAQLSYTTKAPGSVEAVKTYASDGVVVGMWHRGKRTIVITLRPHAKDHGAGLAITFLVEKDEIKRDQVSCFEQWAGGVP